MLVGFTGGGELWSHYRSLRLVVEKLLQPFRGKSRYELQVLVAQLREALPQAEELLVDKLASISWRDKRFLTAEAIGRRSAHLFDH